MITARWAVPFMFLAATALADSGEAPTPPSFSTLITTPLGIEGLTSDYQGNLYAPGRAAAPLPCPVYQVPLDNPTLRVVGNIPAPSATTACSPSGLAFGPDGQLYVTQTDRIYRFTPNAGSPPTATLFASNVPGTNGLAFDKAGNLWTGDGTTGLGRVWKISTGGLVTEMFRVQPMRNSTALGGSVAGDGVGRQARDFPPGPLANNLGGQDLVANGVEFTEDGDLLVADTARGALWKVSFDHHGEVRNRTGCDSTFTANTLCLDSIWIEHPWLAGVGGVGLDRAG